MWSPWEMEGGKSKNEMEERSYLCSRIRVWLGGEGSSDLSSHELFGEKQLSVVACVTSSGRVLGLVRPVLWDLAGCDPLSVLVPHPDVQFTEHGPAGLKQHLACQGLWVAFSQSRKT